LELIKIVVNDNPVRWFKESHFLRKADSAMNKKLSGTYLANLYFEVEDEILKSEKKSNTENEFDEFNEFNEEDTSNTKASIRSPEVISYINKVSNFLKTIKDNNGKAIVGDTTSIVDVLKKIGSVAINDSSIPTSKEQVSQYMFLFESGDTKKGKDMWTLIEPGDSLKSQMWVYFKSGDNQSMNKVKEALAAFIKDNPAPDKLKIEWSGLVYINSVWQSVMVDGMRSSLIGAFLIVLVMMIVLFRSISWGTIAMLPLSLTIMFIYGAIGFAGKFYDMPIAVLSSLTLGLSVDFAIHFIEHAKTFNSKLCNFRQTMIEMFDGTAQAIWRMLW
jgi:predicted RND superfamily exporter protein